MAVSIFPNKPIINIITKLYPQISSNGSYCFINLSPHNNNHCYSSSSYLSYSTPKFLTSYRRRFYEDDDDDDENKNLDYSFNEAVELFNKGDYYKCHDYLEHLWNESNDPLHTLYHGILQCAVGFHHLFNHNHRGAMMELGEGLCKLRKMNFQTGPFLLFERDISATLDFIYQTQLELAACGDDICLAMDQTERSYQLLGGYAAGQDLYRLESSPHDKAMHIIFCHEISYGSGDPPKVKLTTLAATEEHLAPYI